MSITIPRLGQTFGLMVCLMLENSASANTKDQIMFSRYMKYQFCMESVYGQGVYKKLGLSTAMNHWGATEPTQSSILSAPDSVKKVDFNCRKENSINEEVRPN